MTEAEWLACDEPAAMLSFLQTARPSERQLRLFAAACCRDVWDLIEAIESARFGLGCRAVAIAEDLVDGRASLGQVELAVADFGLARGNPLLHGALPGLALSNPRQAARETARWTALAREYQRVIIGRATRERGERNGRGTVAAPSSQQCVLLRDIFGNPFRPVVFKPEWHTSTVL